MVGDAKEFQDVDTLVKSHRFPCRDTGGENVQQVLQKRHHRIIYSDKFMNFIYLVR
jgi:hypothetical protein